MKPHVYILAIALATLSACSDDSERNLPPEFSERSVTVQLAENQLDTGHSARALDPEGSTVAYRLAGGADAALFALTSAGRLNFISEPDFENPGDADADNRYEVAISATDARGRSSSQTVTVSITDENEAPIMDATAVAEVPENSTATLHQLSAEDPEGQALTYTLTGGADAAMFTLTSGGELSAVSAMDFEVPGDADGDNRYQLTVTADDGVFNVSQALTVAITDILPGFSAIDVSAGDQPRSLAFSWSLSDIDPLAVDAVVLHDAAGDGSFVELARVSGTETQAQSEVSLLSLDLAQSQARIELRDDQDAALHASAPFALSSLNLADLIGYFKTANPDARDALGSAVALSADGTTLVVGAPGEDSAASGAGGDASDNTSAETGAVYVFRQSQGNWSQQAYLKASNPDVGDRFGSQVAVSDDGSRIVVSAPFEDSAGNGVNPGVAAQADNSQPDAGAAYVFTENTAGWQQQAYIKPVGGVTTGFGATLAMTGNGEFFALGAPAEASDSGAVYVYEQRSAGIVFSQRLLAPGNQLSARFGSALALDVTGSLLAIAADAYDAATADQGAVFVYNGPRAPLASASSAQTPVKQLLAPAPWQLEATLLAPNPDSQDRFGQALAVDSTANTLVVAAMFEDSAPGAPLPNPAESAAADTGAAYLFSNQPSGWAFDALLKPAAAVPGDNWGNAVAISGDGELVAFSSLNEASSGTGRLERPDNAAAAAGALALFARDGGSWQESMVLKAANTVAGGGFGSSVALARSAATLAVGAELTKGLLSGINVGVHPNSGADAAGAVYLY